MRKKGVLLLKVAISLLLLGLLLRKVRWEQMAGTFAQVHPGYVAASFALSFVLVGSSCWKWWTILRLQHHPVPFAVLYRWYFIGYLYSNFLPSNIGGDLARSWLVGRRIGSQEVSLVAVFAERFTGMVFLLLTVVCSPFLMPALWEAPAVQVAALFAGALLTAILVLPVLVRLSHRSGHAAAALRLARRLLRADRPGRPERLWTTAERRVESFVRRITLFFAILRAEPRAFLSVAALTALFYLLTVANVAVGFRAFGVWPDLVGVAAVLPSALLVASLPIALGSLGLAEGSYVYFFGMLGLGGELTLAMGLLLRAKILFLGLIGLGVQARGEKPPPATPPLAEDLQP